MTMKNMYSLQFDHLTCFIHVNNKEKRMMMNHVFFYVYNFDDAVIVNSSGWSYFFVSSKSSQSYDPTSSVNEVCVLLYNRKLS
jgi:hypothetical protein